MEDKNKINLSKKLEKTEDRLYDRNSEPESSAHHDLHDYHKDLPRKWNTEDSMGKKQTPKKRKHLLYSKGFRQLLFVAGLFFVASLVFAAVTFFRGGTTVSNNNIDIIVLGNSFVDGGEELALQVKVANRNRTPLEIADLLIEYSRGAGGSGDIVRQRISLGEIGAGDVAEEIVNVVVFGEQGTVRDIGFTLEYRVVRSNAVFVKSYTYPVNIANSPVDVIVDGPADVVSNQEFVTEIVVTQNSTEVVENMIVMANYPAGFNFISATPEPNFGDDVWLLGDLAPGTERTINIRGKIRAQNGEERIITIMSGSQDSEDEQEIGVQFTSTPLGIAVGAPFISASLAQGGQESDEFVVDGNQQLAFTLNYENKLQNSLDDLEVVAQFSGSGFDPDRVSVGQGFFNTNNNTIVWNAQNNNNLDTLAPGQTGSFFFFLTPDPDATNPVINVSVDASAVIVGSGTQRESVDDIYSGVIRVESNAQLSGEILHNDGPLVNSGPLPPSVGNETTYTVVLTISSPSNELGNAEVTAELPSYVTWKAQTYPQNEDIAYNNATREVTWDAGLVQSGTGANSQRKAYFKIGFTPSVSHVNLAPPIVTQIKFRAEDSFTGTDLLKQISQLTSSLLRDSGYNPASDRVVQ
jgi:hypothetical protein